MMLRAIRNTTITGTLKRVLPALAVAALVGSVALPAHADDDDWQGHGRGWHHGWEKHHHHYYGPGYYYAPPVYYAPPPAYYGPPAVSFGFNFR